MNKVDFTYNDNKYFIQCKNEDKMKDILIKFATKAGKNVKKFFFLYNGQIINEELNFIKCANSLDRSRNYMNVLVLESQDLDIQNSLIKSNYIICPECKETALISIEDFRIKIYGCKEGHTTKDLKFDEFLKTQYKDQSKIKCDFCDILKSETFNNEFFSCFICENNLCPKCKESHDESHYILKYDESQFFCKLHYESLLYYCVDCNKNLCSKCQIEHKDHNIIHFDNLMTNISDEKSNELYDTKEKIYKLKSFINEMINQLNNLNKNLDNYFEIYNNIISNYDSIIKNYEQIQNIYNIKKFNTDFMRLITEIINDTNIKNKFTSIINLHSKINFEKQKFENNEIYNKKEHDSKYSKYEYEKEETNKSICNPLDNKYDNFNINKIKELQSFTTQNKITLLFVLKDRRILTIQEYFNEKGKLFQKLCVYSNKNGFLCDINIDIEDCDKIFQMDDENVITCGYINKLLKIKKNNIEEISIFDKSISIKKRLLNEKFLIKKSIINEGTEPSNIWQHLASTKFYYEIYSYEKSNLVFYKSINKFYEKYKNVNLLQLNDNELVFYAFQNEKIYGTIDILEFYDLKSEQIINTLKVGKGENLYEMFLLNQDNLIIKGDDTIILIDVKNRKIKKKFKYDIYPENFLHINDKTFLYLTSDKIYQYELEEENNIILKETKEIKNTEIYKYPGNKLIIHKKNKITIFG